MSKAHGATPQHTAHQDKVSIRDPNVSQGRASSPDASVWVGASAGTGKTKVLTDRVLRLLLPRADGQPGTPLHKILCLTFTKAAASEMANRIHDTLSSWSTMPRDELISALEKLTKRNASDNDVNISRQLFSRISDQGDDLKIQTIHAFCQSILGRFPLESGLLPYHRIVEESEGRDMLQCAIDRTLSELANEPGSPTEQAFARLSIRLNEMHIKALLEHVASERMQFNDVENFFFGVDGLYETLCQDLKVPSSVNTDDFIRNACLDESFDPESLNFAYDTMLQYGSKTDVEKAEKIGRFLHASATERMDLLTNDYCYAFFKRSDHEPYSKLITNNILKNEPSCLSILEAEQARISNITETIKSIENAKDTFDILTLSRRILNTFKSIKTGRAVLDYEDLVFYTLSLLQNQKSRLWVMYKMDNGLDHILVDEAQDTNPEQWKIIENLCAEFFSGLGTHDEQADGERTLFVVGDYKQSIYSFQRASPEKFNDMHAVLRSQALESQANWEDVDMSISFRSVQSVLDVVDQVFPDSPHFSFRTGQSGLVELWPLSEPDQFTPPEAWDGPFQIHEKRSETTVLAQNIATQIDAWLKNEDMLESRKRPIKPEDIMILVRTRTGSLIYEIMRQCKLRGIPIGGLDRLVLKDDIAIQDLLALAHWALCPADDLTLAALLKSPLIGLSEEQLYDLAIDRTENLWKTLSRSVFKDIYTYLSTVLSYAGRALPYDFFNQVLQTPCPADSRSGLHGLQTRLGQTCKDPIDEFLNVALHAAKNKDTRNLHDFIHWFSRTDIEIKRDQSAANGIVRIMTVHGAKGLQAPIVILPDTTSTPESAPRHADKRLLWPDKTGLRTPIFAPRKGNESALYKDALQTIKKREMQEYKRLLYVAMTRAEDRLYIAGADKKREISEQCWYSLIKQAMEKIEAVSTLADGTLRFYTPATRDGDRLDRDRTQSPDQQNKTMPDWAYTYPVTRTDQTATNEIIASQSLPASRSEDDARFARGLLIHKLLEILPDVPADQYRSVAQKYLLQNGVHYDREQEAEILGTVLRIINNPDLGWLFAENSRAEVPITYLTPDGVPIYNIIDRLVVLNDIVWIIDYKTDQNPPTVISDIPKKYKTQLRSYAAAIEKIYPGYIIKTALLWTHTGELTEIKIKT